MLHSGIYIKPQKVGKEHIRYSGSPIPLSFSEINYKHQIVDVNIDPLKIDESRVSFESVFIPRSVQLHKIKGELNEVFSQIKGISKR